MKKETELKIHALVENCLYQAVSRELDEDTMASFNSRELTLFIASTLFQTFAAPFVADAYKQCKDLIVSESNNAGVVLTDEETRKIFDKTYEVMKIEGEIDESWNYNWICESEK